MPKLTLFEELFLLAIDDEKGILLSSIKGQLPYGLAGAILAELAVEGKIQVDHDQTIVVADPSPTGDPILDETLGLLRSERPHKAAYWIRALSANTKKLRRKLGQRMVERGILGLDDEQYVWKTVEPPDGSELRTNQKYWIKARLRAAILAKADATARDLALLALVRTNKLLKLIFTSDELGSARQRIYARMYREALNNPCAQTLEAIGDGLARVQTDE